jgi:hypothetical protein
MGFDMHRQFTPATKRGAQGVDPIILGLAVVTVQVVASTIGQAQAGDLSLDPHRSTIIHMAQNGDPGIPARIRRLPSPKTDGSENSDPGTPVPTKEDAAPPSATENKSTHSTDKPE